MEYSAWPEQRTGPVPARAEPGAPGAHNGYPADPNAAPAAPRAEDPHAYPQVYPQQQPRPSVWRRMFGRNRGGEHTQPPPAPAYDPSYYDPYSGRHPQAPQGYQPPPAAPQGVPGYPPPVQQPHPGHSMTSPQQAVPQPMPVQAPAPFPVPAPEPSPIPGSGPPAPAPEAAAPATEAPRPPVPEAAAPQAPAPQAHAPEAPSPAAPAGGGQQVLLPRALANLAMRDLTLVESLLLLIQRLEQREEDPALLDILYQVDHLGTRMRRNCENLLVMAGESVEPPHREPVLLYDVVRAAISEITQYTRVRIQEMPQVFVRERTADDLSHLLAELMDNAVSNSSENFFVTVRGRYMDDGSVVLEVADDGIGMPQDKLARINSDLREPPVLTEESIRHMGLFVVGLLAHRNGVLVQLQTRPFSGTSGFVQVPADVVRIDQRTGDGAAQPREPAAAQPRPAAEQAPPRPAQASEAASASVGPDQPLPPLPKRDPGRGAAGLRVVGDQHPSDRREDSGVNTSANGDAASGDAATDREPGRDAASEPLPELPRRQPVRKPAHAAPIETSGELPGLPQRTPQTPQPPRSAPDPSAADGDEYVAVRGQRGESDPGSVSEETRSYAERIREELSGFLSGQQEWREEAAQRRDEQPEQPVGEDAPAPASASAPEPAGTAGTAGAAEPAGADGGAEDAEDTGVAGNAQDTGAAEKRDVE
ncbi:hypothetical protein HDA32_000800 [Spinactinospora alkalitolerans]|uniref:histidine kinase n=1 Tax=Spinactinospora alkalitolerans TaxID=687207 RepID=A0A852TUT0_9ACTN|nr:sensor histidine kinase [Spinactinospora alkalitolerans]NYE45680.1 hypothetical protein [Spinactinospora alkalitolerans]